MRTARYGGNGPGPAAAGARLPDRDGERPGAHGDLSVQLRPGGPGSTLSRSAPSPTGSGGRRFETVGPGRTFLDWPVGTAAAFDPGGGDPLRQGRPGGDSLPGSE